MSLAATVSGVQAGIGVQRENGLLRGLRRFSYATGVAFLLAGLLSFSAQAAANLPDCLDENRRPMQIDNDAVLRFKESSRNGYQARAYVEGTLSQIFPDRNGHTHFEIAIGTGKTDVLEVVYNVEFGTIPALRVGMRVGACGDYITSIAQNGPYPASPSGAIIHWVHENTRGGGHPSGFLTFEGELYGFPSRAGGFTPPPRHGDEGRGRGNGRGGRGGRNGFEFDVFESSDVAAQGAAL